MKFPILWRAALLWPTLLVAAAPPPPPAGAMACPAPAAPRGPTYLLASEADMVTLLPPPPAAGSAAQQADLQAVIEAQHDAHAADGIAHAIADADPSCGRFADALGDALNDKANAKVLDFLNRAAIEGASLTGPPKRYWKRTRPFASSDQVERLGDMSPDWKARAKTDTVTRDIDAGRKPTDAPATPTPAAAADGKPTCVSDAAGTPAPVKLGRHARALAKLTEKAKADKDRADKDKAAKELAHSSYPSGHSTFGTVCAILLADMVPEKRDALFARNRDYGHSRLVLGAHFPSDVESGRIVGTVAVQLLMQNARFQRDFVDARSSLRTALQLPAQSPDLEPDKEPAADAAAPR